MRENMTGDEIKNKLSELKKVISETKTPQTKLVAQIIASIESFVFETDIYKEIVRIDEEWGDK